MSYIEISVEEYRELVGESARLELISNYIKSNRLATTDDIKALLGFPDDGSDDLPWIVPIPEPVTAKPAPDPEEKKEKKATPSSFIPKVQPRKKNLKELRAFLDAGKTQAWCAEEFGVSPATISLWKKEMIELENQTL